MNDCIFCKILNGEIPGSKIYENEYCIAILDISQTTKGHTLVIPKRHVENIFDLNKEDLFAGWYGFAQEISQPQEVKQFKYNTASTPKEVALKEHFIK